MRWPLLRLLPPLPQDTWEPLILFFSFFDVFFDAESEWNTHRAVVKAAATTRNNSSIKIRDTVNSGENGSPYDR